MTFVTTWMDPQVITLSEVSQRHLSYGITYMWNLKKNGTNECIYKTETGLQMYKV